MQADLKGRTILVVDDAPDSLSLINDTLETEGADTLVALEGKQALSIAKKMRPDLILMDAIMPHMDGFECCQLLKKDPELSSIPVIFMTGLTDTDDVLRGLESGGVDYITKPVVPSELLARIKVHMKNALLASSAHEALDRTGQLILAVDVEGKILWATPQSYALFSKADIPEEWLVTVFSESLRQWFSQNPNSGQLLSLDYKDHSIEVNFVERRTDDTILLKLADGQAVAGEEVLKQKLNLTTRESEVLFWISNGKTNKEIALILDVSSRTINKHLEQIFPKLGVENRTAAAAVAIKALN